MTTIGRLGIRARGAGHLREIVQAAEGLGYGAVWIGGSPGGELSQVSELLTATDHMVVATGVSNIWHDDAGPLAQSCRRIAAAHPGRFLLGVGVGHPEADPAYHQPYESMVDYLDQLDAAGVPVDQRVLSALGPRMLKLSAQRSAGAHPYLTTPEHTRRAREILGSGPLLAPDQLVVLEPDPTAARTIGRPAVTRPYLGLVNYTNNLRRLGYADRDLADGGSDRLIDALVAHGDAAAIAARIQQHLDAGADHVSLNVLAKSADARIDVYRQIAAQFGA